MELLLPKMLWCALLRLFSFSVVLATQVQYGTGSQRDARPEANFDQHCCADLAPAKSSSLASFCSIPIRWWWSHIYQHCWVHPQEPVDRLKYLRGKFLHWMRSWGVVPRLLRHISEGSEQHLFSESEQGQLQGSLAQALDTLGFPCSCEIPIHQPFLLDIWRALTRATFDMDKDLPKLLTEGVLQLAFFPAYLHPVFGCGMPARRL